GRLAPIGERTVVLDLFEGSAQLFETRGGVLRSELLCFDQRLPDIFLDFLRLHLQAGFGLFKQRGLLSQQGRRSDEKQEQGQDARKHDIPQSRSPLFPMCIITMLIFERRRPNYGLNRAAELHSDWSSKFSDSSFSSSRAR